MKLTLCKFICKHSLKNNYMPVFIKLNVLIKIIYTGQDNREINKVHLTLHCLPHFQKILLK